MKSLTKPYSHPYLQFSSVQLSFYILLTRTLIAWFSVSLFKLFPDNLQKGIHLKIIFYFLLLSALLPSFSQTTQIAGTGTLGGGKLFVLDQDGGNPSVMKDFSYAASPQRSKLLESAGKLWGTTSKGGNSDLGVIYSIEVDGSGYTELYSFTESIGGSPLGHLVESSGKIWGTASYNGANGEGSIYRINTDGTGFEKLADFDAALYGAYPAGGLTESDGKLWGMTHGGGSNNSGVIFTIELNGTGLQKIHDFEQASGRYPYGTLVEINNKLWGMTETGGANDDGVVFTIEKNGTNYTVIHEFDDDIDGSKPRGSLMESNGKVWGMTREGGSHNYGVIFTINTDESGFSLVKHFSYPNGGSPYGTLTESNGKLWGMTSLGGLSGSGNIFSIDFDGSGFQNIHNFSSTFGTSPSGDLVESNGKLWGLADSGGPSSGSIFYLNTDGTGITQIHSFINPEGSRPNGSLLVLDDRIWGLHSLGGSHGYGTVYSIRTDGSDYRKEMDFNSSNGRYPRGGLTYSNGLLWGTTTGGGLTFNGVIFSIDPYNTDPNSSPLRNIYNFDNTNGASPFCTLVESNGKLWGTSDYGGINSAGTLFSIDTNGANFQKLHDFDTSGFSTNGSLLPFGNKLWGMTRDGGTYNSGTIFSIDNDGLNFTIVHNFNNTDGKSPYASLTLSNNKFWGMTNFGGDYDAGVIFHLDTNGTNLTKVYDFDGPNGQYPRGNLIEYNGKLWGSTLQGGASGHGVIFSIDPDGTNFEKIHDKGPAFGASESIGSQLLEIHVKEDPVLSFDVADKNYGDEDFLLAASSNSSGLISYQSSDKQLLLISGDSASIRGSGLASITAKQLSDDIYYSATVPVEITIEKKELRVIADDLTKSYGQHNPFPSLSYNGFVYGENESEIIHPPNAMIQANDSSEVGQYDITLSNGTHSNYSFVYQDGTLDVTWAPLLITAEFKFRDYGEQNPEFSMVYSGFVLGEDESVLDQQPVASSIATSTSDAGSYAITISDETDNNYLISTENGLFEIRRNSLMVKANDQNRMYGDQDPEFTLEYSGFIFDDDESDLDQIPVATSSATILSDIGDYPIIVSHEFDNNYELSETEGTLRIVKADQSIEFVLMDTIYEDHGELVLTASASSGLEVSYSSDNFAVAAIGDTILIPIGPGEVNITASQAGDQNFHAAQDVSELLLILPALGIDAGKLNKLNIYPNPTQDYFNIYSRDTEKPVRVTITNAAGQVVRTYHKNQQSDYSLIGLSEGVYLITIESNSQKRYGRIVKIN